jgi:hypothetical protein
MLRAVRAASNQFWPCHLRRLADIGWIGHFRSRLRYEVLKHELSNRQSKPDASDHRVCGPAFHRSGARLSREVWRDHRSYPLVTAFDDRSNVRFPPIVAVQRPDGRNPVVIMTVRQTGDFGRQPRDRRKTPSPTRWRLSCVIRQGVALRSCRSAPDPEVDTRGPISALKIQLLIHFSFATPLHSIEMAQGRD